MTNYGTFTRILPPSRAEGSGYVFAPSIGVSIDKNVLL